MTRLARLSDRAIALALGVAAVLLLLLLGAWNDVPMNDDFSYARTTEAMAKQGSIVFNGWGTPLMLPQMLLGALLIKLFGFSWALLHAIGFVSAGVCAGLIFLLGRACGLERVPALTIAKVLMLSPFFLGAAPTYLTDLPGLSLTLLSLLWLIRALAKGFDPRGFAIAGMLGLVAGMERQSQWLPFLGALGVVAVLVPAARRLAMLYAGAILATAVPLVRWFDSHAYSVPVNFSVGLNFLLLQTPVAFRFIYRFLNLLGIFVLPFAIPALAGRTIRWLLMGALLLFALLPLVHPMGTRNLDFLGVPLRLTYYGQYFTSSGIVVGAVDGFVDRPLTLPLAVCSLLAVLGGLGVGVGGYLLLDWWEAIGARRKEKTLAPSDIAVSALSVYATVQILAFLPWIAQQNMFDRYFLPILPCVLILHATQAAKAPKPVRWLPIVFASLYGMYGLASAAEYFGLTRARQALYRRLLLQGVPETQIDGGFELNADLQVRLRGHINNVAIANPPGAFDETAKGGYLAYAPELFPAIDARWRLATRPADDVEPAPVDSVTYFSPLPPFSRTVGVYKIVRPD